MFSIKNKSAAGRIGLFETPHGIVETPTVMPVINPNIELIRPQDMRSFGAQMLITNSYIIYRNVELRERALGEGLHRMLGFDGAIMTDSGSYQLSVYGDVEVSSQEIVGFQREIGTDVGVPLDIPTPPDVPRERAQSELDITISRVREAKTAAGNMMLAAPLQGSTFPDLRAHAAGELGKDNFDLYAIGAVVPLMESYRFAELVDVIASVKRSLQPNAPVHLFGAGHPMMFALAAALGIDLFDSAAYALYAKAGRYITASGTHDISGLEYLPCTCPVCTSHTPAELRDNKLLARHNLYVTFGEIREIKQCIRDGTLWELVERRCRAHPLLLSGLRRALSHSDWIEELEPLPRAAFFYTGGESAWRPIVRRYSARLARFSPGARALISAEKHDYEEDFDDVFGFVIPFGPYPVELKETLPLNTEPPEPDYDGLAAALENTRRLIELNPDTEFVIDFDFEHPMLDKIKEMDNVTVSR